MLLPPEAQLLHSGNQTFIHMHRSNTVQFGETRIASTDLYPYRPTDFRHQGKAIVASADRPRLRITPTNAPRQSCLVNPYGRALRRYGLPPPRGEIDLWPNLS